MKRSTLGLRILLAIGVSSSILGLPFTSYAANGEDSAPAVIPMISTNYETNRSEKFIPESRVVLQNADGINSFYVKKEGQVDLIGTSVVLGIDSPTIKEKVDAIPIDSITTAVVQAVGENSTEGIKGAGYLRIDGRLNAFHGDNFIVHGLVSVKKEFYIDNVHNVNIDTLSLDGESTTREELGSMNIDKSDSVYIRKASVNNGTFTIERTVSRIGDLHVSPTGAYYGSALGNVLKVDAGGTAIITKPWKKILVDKKDDKVGTVILDTIESGIDSIEHSDGAGVQGGTVKVRGDAYIPNFKTFVKEQDHPVTVTIGPVENTRANLSFTPEAMISNRLRPNLTTNLVTYKNQLIAENDGNIVKNFSDNISFTNNVNIFLADKTYTAKDLEAVKSTILTGQVHGDVIGLGTKVDEDGTEHKPTMQDLLTVNKYSLNLGRYMPGRIDKDTVQELKVVEQNNDNRDERYSTYDDSTAVAQSGSFVANSLDLGTANKLTVVKGGILNLVADKQFLPTQFLTSKNGNPEVTVGDSTSSIIMLNTAETQIPVGTNLITVKQDGGLILRGVSLDAIDIQGQTNSLNSTVLLDNTHVKTINSKGATIAIATEDPNSSVTIDAIDSLGPILMKSGDVHVNSLALHGSNNTSTPASGLIYYQAKLHVKKLDLANTINLRIKGGQLIAKNDLDSTGKVQPSLSMDANSYVVVGRSGMLIADVKDLGGGTIFSDPAYLDAPTYTQLNIIPTEINGENVRSLNGHIIAGQNAVVSLGDGFDAKQIPGLLKEYALGDPKHNENKAEGDPLNVGSITYVSAPIVIDKEQGALVVDPSLRYDSSTPEIKPQSTAGAVSVEKDGLLLFNEKDHKQEEPFIKSKSAVLSPGAAVLLLNAKPLIKYPLITTEDPVTSDVSKVMASINNKAYIAELEKSADNKTIFLYAKPNPTMPNLEDEIPSDVNDIMVVPAIVGIQSNTLAASGLLSSAVDRFGLYKGLWATYVHQTYSAKNKELLKGLKVLDGRSKRDAIILGNTFTSDAGHNIGIAVAYTSGKDTIAHTHQLSTKDKDQYYSIDLYDYYERGPVTLTADLSYTHGAHDLGIMSVNKHYQDTFSSAAFSAGLNAQRRYQLTPRFTLTPYTGVRYTNLQTGDVKLKELSITSNGQDILSVPIGIGLSADLQHGQWRIEPSAQLGYQWNLSGRDVQIKSIMADNTVNTKATVLPKGVVEGKIGVIMSNGKNAYSLYYGYNNNNGEHNKQLTAQARITF